MKVYWVYLNDPHTHTPLLRPGHDGLNEAAVLFSGLAHCEMSVVLGPGFYIPLDDLNGKRAEETEWLLQEASEALDVEQEYRHVYEALLAWSREHPDGIWRIE